MKKILLALCLIAGTLTTAQAQNKFGYLNFNELFFMLPESVQMQEELQTYAQKLESQLTAMQAEYESKVTEFQQNETTYTDLVKEDKVREVESIQKRMVDFRQSAQKSLGEKEQELLTPIREKAMAAIDDVAKENNFTYIFDTGAGTFLYVDESQNILSLVKAKLGL